MNAILESIGIGYRNFVNRVFYKSEDRICRDAELRAYKLGQEVSEDTDICKTYKNFKKLFIPYIAEIERKKDRDVVYKLWEDETASVGETKYKVALSFVYFHKHGVNYLGRWANEILDETICAFKKTPKEHGVYDYHVSKIILDQYDARKHIPRVITFT
uniref:Uncharacterized protein n=1 Tax=Abalone asfa-like virus TaxID=2839893 RepID=A0A5K7Y3C9_9VIRU|nr:hypothetical protein [Abalone asfa-like virus]BCY04644.1 hypothetical protein [Abalone asfa-like virus]